MNPTLTPEQQIARVAAAESTHGQWLEHPTTKMLIAKLEKKKKDNFAHVGAAANNPDSKPELLRILGVTALNIDNTLQLIYDVKKLLEA